MLYLRTPACLFAAIGLCACTVDVSAPVSAPVTITSPCLVVNLTGDSSVEYCRVPSDGGESQ